MNYTLNTSESSTPGGSVFSGIQRLIPLLLEEKIPAIIALVAIVCTSVTTLVSPILIAHAVDTSIQLRDFAGVLYWSLLLLGIYIVGLVASYVQTITMGGIGRRVLFKLRNTIFNKLQELPVAFFNQNKAGDLISRINNDTDKLNQFFAQALMQFIGNFFLIIGSGIFLVALHPYLGLAALVPAFVVLIITQVISPWVKRVNFTSLQTIGGMSSEIQESINNFRVIVAFNRLDYFRTTFATVNENNFRASISAGIANTIFTPLYGLAYNLGQLIVLAYGIILISQGQFTVGLLIGFLLYVNNFYNPLRQLASVWSSMQLALAGLDRISEVLALESNMCVIESKGDAPTSDNHLEFIDVSFGYIEGQDILSRATLLLEKGKTYALVGPTGGGKSTTASLMARLYDPTQGTILLNGEDIRTFTPETRAKKIGFILQEPFLFTGTVRDNILYGNDQYLEYSNEQFASVLTESHLNALLSRFEKGLDTPILSSGDSLSLGQKQLIAFMRAVLRAPQILILDEATANIDTVTEQLLGEILNNLPPTTTKVIIAHRLNTIENADEIFFVNGGHITRAGSLDDALELLLHGKRSS